MQTTETDMSKDERKQLKSVTDIAKHKPEDVRFYPSSYTDKVSILRQELIELLSNAANGNVDKMKEMMNDAENGVPFASKNIIIQANGKFDLDYEQIHVFRISNALAQVLWNTKNEAYKRKHPFNKIFLILKIPLSDGNVLDGLFIDATLPEDSKKIPEGDESWVEMLQFQALPLINAPEVYTPVENKKILDVPIILYPGERGKVDAWNEAIKELGAKAIISKKDNRRIQIFIMSFFDFLNNPEVKMVPMPAPSAKNIERKIREGKPISPPEVIIKVDGQLKVYLDKIESLGLSGRHFNQKFWVRGHYTHFWNKNRFRRLYMLIEQNLLPKEYEFEAQMGVVKRWKKPTVKGQGIMVNKQYELIKEVRNG